MKISQYFSLRNASETKRIAPRELVPPVLETLTNFFINHDNYEPEAPMPSATPTASSPTPPCTIGVTATWWVTLGAYIVALKAEGNDEEIYWSAPYRPGMWDVTETIGTAPNTMTVYTGAGEAELAEEGTVTHGVNIGGVAVISRGNRTTNPAIGFLATSGQFNYPVVYNKISDSMCSWGVMRAVDGLAWFVSSDGTFCKCDGTAIEEASPYFDISLLSNNGSDPFPTTVLSTQGLFVATGTTGTSYYINMSNGCYSTYDTTTVPTIVVGRLPLVTPDRMADIKFVRVSAYNSGTELTLNAFTKSLEDSEWVTCETATLTTSGEQEVIVSINQNHKDPQLKLTLTGTPTKVVIHGFYVLYEDGGARL